ncbi:MAG: ATP-binding cassette domain-containing protein [Acidimicrobiia bacterium]|nr:ATP-binding cassette domain-containing protein [Acidimicrobiia bacterium]
MFPDRRRDLLFPTAGSVGLFAVLVGGALIYAAVLGGSAERLITAMFIDAIMVIGIQIYIGNTGVLSFGHIGFGAVAGYVFAIFAIDPERKARWIADAPAGLDQVQVSPIVATLIAVAVTLVVAVVVGIGLARSGAKSGAVAATVITLALLFVTHEVAINWTQLTGGNRAPLSFGIGDTLDSMLPILAVLLVAIVAARLFAQSRAGRLAKAAREDNLAARAMGVDPQVQQMAALLLSVAVVAVAASLRVYEIGNITPRFFFFEYTLLTLVMLIVGGRNSVTGAVVGVVVITAARELTRRLATEGYELFGLSLDAAAVDWIFREGLPTIGLGLAMLGFMIFRPNGLMNDWELDEWLARRWLRPQEPGRPTLGPIADGAAHSRARLEADGLTVDFGGFRALGSAGIVANVGEIVGLIGPNGAGKTTLVNVLTGIVAPTAGRVLVDSDDLTGEPSHEIARRGLVRTFQNLRLFSALSVRDNVEAAYLIAEAHRDGRSRPSIDELIAVAGLWDHRHRRADELDYGNSRRLELARAAAAAPTFLLLDEPTSGMSDAESLAMVEQVRTMAETIGAGVVVIDHDLNFITGICDRIYCLDRGAVIASGTPDEIHADPTVQAAYLGTAAPA